MGMFAAEYKLHVHAIFYATGHGKTLGDAEGGEQKGAVSRQEAKKNQTEIIYADNKVWAEQCVNFLQKRYELHILPNKASSTKWIHKHYIYYGLEAVVSWSGRIPNQVKGNKGNLSTYHCYYDGVSRDMTGSVWFRAYPCACRVCLKNMRDHVACDEKAKWAECENYEYVGDWFFQDLIVTEGGGQVNHAEISRTMSLTEGITASLQSFTAQERHAGGHWSEKWEVVAFRASEKQTRPRNQARKGIDKMPFYIGRFVGEAVEFSTEEVLAGDNWGIAIEANKPFIKVEWFEFVDPANSWRHVFSARKAYKTSKPPGLWNTIQGNVQWQVKVPTYTLIGSTTTMLVEMRPQTQVERRGKECDIPKMVNWRVKYDAEQPMVYVISVDSAEHMIRAVDN